ncbi:MAG TPA: peptidoglycan DD-metalloendopeptidase family protein [Candidatus Woesebacteria bacterium]|nr:peptidoglycan DD-metalloendopeptidase family protein [Candidatus Woesebacteria bacterium]
MDWEIKKIIGELVAGNKTPEFRNGLKDLLKELGYEGEIDFDNEKELKEIISFLESFKDEEEVLESRVLNKEKLEELLADYDSQKDGTPEEYIERVTKDPKIRGQLLRAIEKKREIAKQTVAAEVEERTKEAIEKISELRQLPQQEEVKLRREIERRVKDSIIEGRELNYFEINEKKERGLNLSELISQKTGIEVGQIEMEVVKPLEAEIDNYVVNNSAKIDEEKRAQLKEQIVKLMGKTPEAEEWAEYITEIVVPENDRQETRIAQIHLRTNNQSVSPEAIETAKAFKNAFYGNKKVTDVLEKIKNIPEILEKIPEVSRLKGVAKTIALNPRIARLVDFGRSFYNAQTTGFGFQAKLYEVLGLSKLREGALAWATRVGGETVGAMASQISVFGLEQGLRSIATQLITTGSVKVATATATVATSVAADAGAAVATATIPVAGWVVSLALVGVDLVLGLAKSVAIRAKNALINLGLDNPITGAVIKTVEVADGLWRGTQKVIAGLMAGIIGLLSGITGLGIAALVIPIILGILVYQTIFVANPISSLVPAKGIGGGTCIKKTELYNTDGSGSLANCNENALKTDAISIDKRKYVNVAERWRSGGAKNAERCFNDVVCRAKNAGVNPDFALWAWLHESGASNYDGFQSEIEDFGIHGKAGVDKENFEQQINYFLDYFGDSSSDPGRKCPELGYWLSLSTWYLSGSCDPNKIVKGGAAGETTGRDYLKELQETWSWISDSELPASVLIEKQECGGGTAQDTFEYTDENGELWVCEDDPDNPTFGAVIDLEPLDPNKVIPEGCPEGFPTNGGVRTIVQGPRAKGCSHANMDNAVDFAVGAGTEIRATHDGIARSGYNAIYGYYVDVTGKCNGAVFSTRYAHQPSLPFEGTKDVKKGDKIGVVNNTGHSTGNHLHYDFRGGSIGIRIDESLHLTKSLTGCCNAENGIYCY